MIGMTISGRNAADALVNAPSPGGGGSVRAEVGVRMLKKAQDQMTQQGEAMVKLADEAAPANHPYHLDAYA